MGSRGGGREELGGVCHVLGGGGGIREGGSSGVQMGGFSQTKTQQQKGKGHALGRGEGWGGETPMLLTHGVSDEFVTIQVSIRQHTSAYVSIRQHTSYVSILQHTSAYVSIRMLKPMLLTHGVGDEFVTIQVC
jgi:hypothetical protein